MINVIANQIHFIRTTVILNKSKVQVVYRMREHQLKSDGNRTPILRYPGNFNTSIRGLPPNHPDRADGTTELIADIYGGEEDCNSS